MINLLSPKQKKEIQQEETFKLVLILGIIFLIFLVCFSLILTSINIILSGEVEAQKILYEQREKEFETPQMQVLQKNLASFNQTIFQLDSFYQSQTNLTGVLEKISQTLPSGVYLTSLLAASKKEGGLSCTLSGFSPTRESLLDLKANLEKEENFEKISFPPVSWVEPENIDFTVNLEIKNESGQ
jgi:Tfp pilus assembly protein PilN